MARRGCFGEVAVGEVLHFEALELLDEALFQLANYFGRPILLVVQFLDIEEHLAPLFVQVRHAVVVEDDLVHFAEDLFFVFLQLFDIVRNKWLQHRMQGFTDLALNADGHVLLNEVLDHGEVVLVVLGD